ncbi:MAG: acyltransferase family protein [Povalibacter sp.]
MNIASALPANNPALTGIRGLAAAWVFWHHLLPISEFLGIQLGGRYLQPFFDEGFRGVDLFFILSGFILMYVHASDFRAPDLQNLRRFFLLRIFRIYPVHLAVLVGIFVLVHLLPAFAVAERAYFPEAFFNSGLWRTALLVQNWGHFSTAIWNAPAWTLSAEVLGYMTFPLFAFAIVRIRKQHFALALSVGLLTSLCVLLLVSGRAFENQWGGYGLIRMALQLIAGIALCQYFRLSSSDRYAPAVAAIAALAILLTCLFVPALASVSPLLFACLILSLAYQKGMTFKFFSSRPVVFMGEISYSFYLCHWILIHLTLWLLKSHLIGLQWGPVVLWVEWVPCVLVSYALYRTVELPGRKRGRAFIKRVQAGEPLPAAG